MNINKCYLGEEVEVEEIMAIEMETSSVRIRPIDQQTDINHMEVVVSCEVFPRTNEREVLTIA